MEYIEPPPTPKPEEKKRKEKFLKVLLNEEDEREIVIQKAKVRDVEEILELVNAFAAMNLMLPRGPQYLYENIRDLFVVRDGDEVIGYAAHHIFWSDLTEIRAVAVAREKQNQGAGALLVDACLEEARGLGVETVFCLTYKPQFFEKLGFRLVDRGELPRKVWGECLRCPKFPDCDEVALVYQVKTTEWAEGAQDGG